MGVDGRNFEQELNQLQADNKRLDRDFNEMRLFHRDVVNEMKNQGTILTELKDYVKQLADFKSATDQSLALTNQLLHEHREQEADTIKRIFKVMEEKEELLEARIMSIESDRKWVVRIVFSAIILGLLYLLGLKGH